MAACAPTEHENSENARLIKIDRLAYEYAMDHQTWSQVESQGTILPRKRLAHRLHGRTAAAVSDADYAALRASFEQFVLDAVSDQALAYTQRTPARLGAWENRTGKCGRCAGTGIFSHQGGCGVCFRCGGSGNPPAIDDEISISRERARVKHTAQRSQEQERQEDQQ